AAVRGVGQSMVSEPATKARVVTITIQSPGAGIIAKIDVAHRDAGKLRIVHLASLISGPAVGGIGFEMAVERTAEPWVIAFPVVRPIARIITEIDFRTGLHGAAD